MPGDGHAGFGERPGETGQEQSGYRAPDRLNRPIRVAVSGLIPAGVFPGDGRGLPAARLFCGLSGVLGSGRGRGGRGAVGGGPGRGWSGRCGGRPAGGVERFGHSCSRCQPSGRWRVRRPRPCRAVRAATAIRSRRMVAARALARGGTPGRRRRGPGCAPSPRSLARRRSRRKPRRAMSKRAAGDVGEDLLHDGVAPALPLGLDRHEWRIGEDGMAAPGGKQLVLPRRPACSGRGPGGRSAGR